MYKKILCLSILLTNVLHGIMIDQDFLKNCPTLYLIDIADGLRDPQVTQLIGVELCNRNSIETLPILAQSAGELDTPPSEPAEGHTFSTGVWVWIANNPDSQSGMWCWVPRTMPYYIALLSGHLPPG